MTGEPVFHWDSCRGHKMDLRGRNMIYKFVKTKQTKYIYIFML